MSARVSRHRSARLAVSESYLACRNHLTRMRRSSVSTAYPNASDVGIADALAATSSAETSSGVSGSVRPGRLQAAITSTINDASNDTARPTRAENGPPAFAEEFSTRVLVGGSE